MTEHQTCGLKLFKSTLEIQSGTSFLRLCARGSSKHEKCLITSYVGGLPTDSRKTNQQLGNSRYHDQTAGVTGVATLVADCHAHVKDAQGVDEAGSEAQDVLDQLKSEIVTSIVCGDVDGRVLCYNTKHAKKP